MKKIKIILALLFFIGLNLNASDAEFFKPRSILVQDMLNEKFLSIPEQYRINKQSIEVLDLNEQDTFSNYTFAELIKEASPYGPYLLARVTTEGFVHYFDGTHLRNHLMNDIDANPFLEDKDSLDEYLSKKKNPNNGLPITGVQFFVVHNLYEANFRYCYDMSDLYIKKSVEEKLEIINTDIHPTFKAAMQISIITSSKDPYQQIELLKSVISNDYALAKHKSFAQMMLGTKYKKSKHFAEALKLFREIIENPYSEEVHKIYTRYYLGKFNFYGYGIEKNLLEAKKLFLIVANASFGILPENKFPKDSLKYIAKINKTLGISKEETMQEIDNTINKRFGINLASVNRGFFQMSELEEIFQAMNYINS
ncbi:MAG: hypothetical protein P4L22_04515 [Candidatus Babeliales bacterium]|nr:hypothetical protein [Candidatus Babeliales bacterium]